VGNSCVDDDRGNGRTDNRRPSLCSLCIIWTLGFVVLSTPVWAEECPHILRDGAGRLYLLAVEEGRLQLRVSEDGGVTFVEPRTDLTRPLERYQAVHALQVSPASRKERRWLVLFSARAAGRYRKFALELQLPSRSSGTPAPSWRKPKWERDGAAVP